MIYAAVVAHPDDEVLGCGGTLARLSSEGHEVHVVILGEGATARADVPSDATRALEVSSREAAKILGVTVHTSRGMPRFLMDNQFDRAPLLHVIQNVEDAVKAIKPEIVFTHNPHCLNIDHRLTCQAVLTATRPGTSSVRAVYAFETPSATEWAFGALGVFQPTLFWNIYGNSISKKMEAMQAYRQEMRDFPHPRSYEALVTRATFWGSVVGVGAAEAFMVLRDMR